MNEESKCPVTGRTSKPIAGGGTSHRDWWPNQLNLKILHQHSPMSNPMGGAFNYAGDFGLASSDRFYYPPYGEYDILGFRVASVPEPTTLALFVLGGLAVMRRRR